MKKNIFSPLGVPEGEGKFKRTPLCNDVGQCRSDPNRKRARWGNREHPQGGRENKARMARLVLGPGPEDLNRPDRHRTNRFRSPQFFFVKFEVEDQLRRLAQV